MSRYIDGDRLLKRAKKALWYAETDERFQKPIPQKELISDFIKEIEKAPTADVEEVRHGEWIENSDSDHNWKCSSCGYGYTDYKLTYCYDCGAKMDGGKK